MGHCAVASLLAGQLRRAVGGVRGARRNEHRADHERGKDEAWERTRSEGRMRTCDA